MGPKTGRRCLKLEDELEDEFRITMPINDWLDADKRLDEDGLREKSSMPIANYRARREQMGDEHAA